MLTAILLLCQFLILNALTNRNPSVTVYAASRNIAAGEVITEEMFFDMEVSHVGTGGNRYYDSFEICGMAAKYDIFEGEIILSERLGLPREGVEKGLFGKNTRLFTIEFKADQANGWLLEGGDHVDIIYIANNSEEIIRVENVKIASIINDRGGLYERGEGNALPKFISFEIDNGLDEFLAHAKGNGRLELSVIP